MSAGEFRTVYEYGKKLATTVLLSSALVLTPLTGILGNTFGGSAEAAVTHTLFFDDFESGDFSNWDNNGIDWSVLATDSASAGTHHARGHDADDNNLYHFLIKNIDTTGYENIEVSFSYKRSGLEETDFARLSYNAGTSYILHDFYGETGTGDDDTTWQSFSGGLGAVADNAANVSLTISIDAADSEYFRVDDFKVTGELIGATTDTTDPSSSIITPEHDAVVLTGASITNFTSVVSDETSANEDLSVVHSFNPDRPGLVTLSTVIYNPSATGINSSPMSGTTLASLTGMIPGDTFSWKVTVLDEAGNASVDTKYDLVFRDPVARNIQDNIYFATIQEAIDAATTGAGETIELLSDVTIDSQITIDKDIQLEGNGHTIHGAFTKSSNSNNAIIGVIGTDGVTIQNLVLDGVSGASLHGINFYEASHSTISNITVADNDNAGIIVNGSNVVADNLTTIGNGWYGVGIDQGTGVTTPTVFTAQNTSSHDELAHVKIDDKTKDVQFNDDDNQYELVFDANNVQVYNLITPQPEACISTSTFDDFTLGSVNGQSGWSSTGPYDQEIVDNIYGYTAFGCKSLRISNATTQGSFGDQTFSASVANEAGETDAENNGLSGGERKDTFTATWSFASTTPTEYQPGLQVTASPDRGDGARMSYIQMVDQADGLAVNFYDYQTGASPNKFVLTQIVHGLDRSVPHQIMVVMNFVDGPSNDVVKVYVDGVLMHTGTSWEDYFREVEETESRTVDSILFRAAGTAAPVLDGKGFLIDNLSITTSNIADSTPTTPVTPTSPVTTPVVAQTSTSVLTSLLNGNQAGSGAVLASTTNSEPAQPNEAEENASDVLATNTDEDANNDSDSEGCFEIFGICWYWWIVPLVAILLYLYYRARKEADEE